MEKNKFIEVIISCDDDQKELALAALDEMGFDSAIETDDGLSAYFTEENFNQNSISSLLSTYGINTKIRWSYLENKNWNEEWEKNFNPVVVDKLCLIRAPFHKSDESFDYEIIIQPKMSFGTGHHNTTYLMVKNQIKNIDHKDKIVLDCGCGTAILAVMAEKLGAKVVIGNDVDEWSIENAPENVALNHCMKIQIREGSIENLDLRDDFDIILANINKNILIAQLSHYASLLKEGGELMISGFYKKDSADIDKVAQQAGFRKVMEDNKDDWACIHYKKSVMT